MTTFFLTEQHVLKEREGKEEKKKLTRRELENKRKQIISFMHDPWHAKTINRKYAEGMN